ncbi:hypothetical protein PtB15_4B777 [Puccinia triticina]|nr:hypothetical protein PtB15_4B777 [Puccinia triticina]
MSLQPTTPITPSLSNVILSATHPSSALYSKTHHSTPSHDHMYAPRSLAGNSNPASSSPSHSLGSPTSPCSSPPSRSPDAAQPSTQGSHHTRPHSTSTNITHNSPTHLPANFFERYPSPQGTVNIVHATVESLLFTPGLHLLTAPTSNGTAKSRQNNIS